MPRRVKVPTYDYMDSRDVDEHVARTSQWHIIRAEATELIKSRAPWCERNVLGRVWLGKDEALAFLVCVRLTCCYG